VFSAGAGWVGDDELQRLRELLPGGIKLVQVIHVVDECSVDDALAVGSFVDALLLDSGNSKLAIKELGGTGRTHGCLDAQKKHDFMSAVRQSS